MKIAILAPLSNPGPPELHGGMVAQRLPLRHLNQSWAGTVRNGIPVESCPLLPEPGEYLPFVPATAVP